MAKKYKPYVLPLTTMVDVVGIKGERVFIKTMPYSEALKIKPSEWRVIIYQVGYHSFKSTE